MKWKTLVLEMQDEVDDVEDFEPPEEVEPYFETVETANEYV